MSSLPGRPKTIQVSVSAKQSPTLHGHRGCFYFTNPHNSANFHIEKPFKMKKIPLKKLLTLEHLILEAFTSMYQKRTPFNGRNLLSLGNLIAIYICFHKNPERATIDRNVDSQTTITSICNVLFQKHLIFQEHPQTEEMSLKMRLKLDNAFRKHCNNENFEFEDGFEEIQSMTYLSELTTKRTIPIGRSVPVLLPKGSFFYRKP